MNNKTTRTIPTIRVSYTKPRMFLTCTQEELQTKLFEAYIREGGSTFNKEVLKEITLAILKQNSTMVGGDYTIVQQKEEL